MVVEPPGTAIAAFSGERSERIEETVPRGYSKSPEHDSAVH